MKIITTVMIMALLLAFQMIGTTQTQENSTSAALPDTAAKPVPLGNPKGAGTMGME